MMKPHVEVMKLLNFFLALTTVAMAPAKGETFSFNWDSGFTGGTVIPDGALAGWFDTRSVNNLPQTITGLQITLNVSGGFNGDLYGYISHGNSLVVLLNRVGRGTESSFGYSDSGLNVIFDDTSATDFHLYGGNGGSAVSGTFEPDGRNISPLSSPGL